MAPNSQMMKFHEEVSKDIDDAIQATKVLVVGHISSATERYNTNREVEKMLDLVLDRFMSKYNQERINISVTTFGCWDMVRYLLRREYMAIIHSTICVLNNVSPVHNWSSPQLADRNVSLLPFARLVVMWQSRNHGTSYEGVVDCIYFIPFLVQDVMHECTVYRMLV